MIFITEGVDEMKLGNRGDGEKRPRKSQRVNKMATLFAAGLYIAVLGTYGERKNGLVSFRLLHFLLL